MKIGDKVTFIPSAWTQKTDVNALEAYGAAKDVTGRIERINRAHRWFRVAYEAAGATQYECFKF